LSLRGESTALSASESARALSMEARGEEMKMKCPKCGRFTLHENTAGVSCRTCGYELSPGEVDRYRLFRLLREEERRAG